MNINEYVKLTAQRKYNAILPFIDPDVFDVNPDGNDLKIKHLATGLDFVFVPGGSYTKGLTDEEYSLVRKINDHEFEDIDLGDLRPVHSCTVKDFLLTDYPVSWEALSAFYPEYVGNRGAAWLDKETVDKICSRFDLRLPSDDEMEYVARCGKQQLFPFGNELLQNEAELEKWLVVDYSRSNMLCNDLGVYGLFRGEWTNTHYTRSYSKADRKHPQEEFCIRGGASIFFPWQDCGEWLSCICAYRMSSDGLFKDKAAAFRFVYELQAAKK